MCHFNPLIQASFLEYQKTCLLHLPYKVLTYPLPNCLFFWQNISKSLNCFSQSLISRPLMHFLVLLCTSCTLSVLFFLWTPFQFKWNRIIAKPNSGSLKLALVLLSWLSHQCTISSQCYVGQEAIKQTVHSHHQVSWFGVDDILQSLNHRD